MRDFQSFHQQATGHRPDEYHARIARAGLPDVVRAPTGAGKASVILAWLWRRLYGPDPAGTPRRLIYALPQRSLTEPLAAEFAADGPRSWRNTVRALREKHGPFVLAYLEALVRVADWRASGGFKLADNNKAIDVSTKSVLDKRQ